MTTDEQNVPQNCTNADIVRALNNIYLELKTLNQTMAKATPAAPAGPRSYGHSAAASSPMGDGAAPTGRPRLSGAAGRVHGKTARSDRQDKGGKFQKSGPPGKSSSGKSGGGYPKRPKSV